MATRLRLELNTINHPLDNSTQAHYMLGMIADWKAKHQRKHGRAQAVPVYVPVRDPDGRWRLELVGHTELDLNIRVDPSSTR